MGVAKRILMARFNQTIGKDLLGSPKATSLTLACSDVLTKAITIWLETVPCAKALGRGKGDECAFPKRSQ
jgi:hypothetical protein